MLLRPHDRFGFRFGLGVAAIAGGERRLSSEHQRSTPLMVAASPSPNVDTISKVRSLLSA